VMWVECGVPTYTKFCSRSCAASVNNSKFPKRTKTEKVCVICFGPSDRGKRCAPCRDKASEDYLNTTKAMLRGDGNMNFNSRLPHIRSHAKSAYLKSDRPLVCNVCGYDIHVEIAHIKAIKDFSEESTIREINDASNLVALCRNHHWEFDNGHLTLQGNCSLH
jgi:HNH endonuclease